MSKSILMEAEELTNKDRRDDYGHPLDDFTKTAKIWSAILGMEVDAKQVALCMIGVKISRELNKHQRDNLVDGAGYFNCLDMIYEEEERRNPIKTITVLKCRDRLPPLYMPPQLLPVTAISPNSENID